MHELGLGFGLRPVADVGAAGLEIGEGARARRLEPGPDPGGPWTGLFGTHVSVVPLVAAELRGEELHVPFDKQQLKTAPHHDPGLELSPQDEIDLFDHYGLPYHDPMPRPTPGMTAERAVGAVGRADEAQWVRDTSGAVTDDAMTRSEERLRVRTESQPASRVRLRKHVVTEYQQVTVPVRREEIRLEREPAIDPGPDVTASTSDDGTPVETRPPVGSEAAGRLRSDDEHVVTFYEERPVLGTETVPVERVRLGKQTVIEQQTVGGPLRRELRAASNSATPGTANQIAVYTTT